MLQWRTWDQKIAGSNLYHSYRKQIPTERAIPLGSVNEYQQKLGSKNAHHTELHWLDVPQRINYKLGMLMYRCQHNKARRYLMDHCTSVSDVAYRQWLSSASSHEVSLPRHRLSTYGRRAFAIAGPTVWNSLPEDMRDPDVSEHSYRQSMKTFLFSQY